jgi:hypothetical protein
MNAVSAPLIPEHFPSTDEGRLASRLTTDMLTRRQTGEQIIYLTKHFKINMFTVFSRMRPLFPG